MIVFRNRMNDFIKIISRMLSSIVSLYVDTRHKIDCTYVTIYYTLYKRIIYTLADANNLITIAWNILRARFQCYTRHRECTWGTSYDLWRGPVIQLPGGMLRSVARRSNRNVL